MTRLDPAVADAAALWLVRTRDPRFADWEGLMTWLEQDPAHNLAYEAALDAHDESGVDQPPAPVSDIPAPVPRTPSRWPLWAGGTLATAASLAVAMVGLPRASSPTETTIATVAGEHRAVRLDDGTLIELNGATRITLNGKDGRTARLDAGEAMFDVVHDESRPFTVDVGGQRLVDIGTRFDVLRSARRSQIAVAEGTVLYDPEGAAVRLGAGRVLRKRDDSNLVEVAEVQPRDVGTWRQRRLVYRDAPLNQVADDLGRLVGTPITVAPDVGARAFTGAIIVERGDQDRTFARMAKILNVAFSRRSGGWYLSSATGAGR